MRMQALWAARFLRMTSTTMPNPAAEPRHAGWLRRVAIAAFWILVWEAASLFVGSPILLAGPVDTLLRLASFLPDPAFWGTLALSFWQIFLGFIGGFAAALVLGFLSHRFRPARELLAPLFDALKSIPLVCIIVLLLLWVGSKKVSALAVFLAVFPAVYFSVLEGLDAQDPKLRELLHAMRTSGMRIFLVDTWQQLLPFLLGTARNVCGMAWKAGVAAEVIGTPRNTIGEAVYQSKLLLETADLFAWTIAIVAASWACERLFLALLEKSGFCALKLALRGRHASTERIAPASVKVHDLTLGYETGESGKTVLAEKLSFTLDVGTRWILTDASGTGKTTFIACAAGLRKPLAGSIDSASALSLMCQEARLVEAYTAEENVELVSALTENEARSLLLELLPKSCLGRPVSELSGGQRRRVELVRALAHASGLVLLDEPFASLDERTHKEAAAFILRHLEGRTLIVASHAQGDRKLVAAEELELFGR